MEHKLDISALKKANQALGNVLALAGKVEAKPQNERDFYEFERL